jgi:predicted enzyme related to lactoylglutathione lyase
MTSRIASVTFDCEDAVALSSFWSRVVGREVSPGPPEPSEFFCAIPPGDDGSPMMMFLKVPEGKTAKNRVHVDLATDDRDAEVARLIGLGATHVHDKNEFGLSWTTLQDPEGNEFCVAGHFDAPTD